MVPAADWRDERMTEKHPKHREIETRTKKIREHLTKAHATADSRSELGHALANASAEIQILLREIEEIASTIG
jgi:hypothetical protein